MNSDIAELNFTLMMLSVIMIEKVMCTEMDYILQIMPTRSSSTAASLSIIPPSHKVPKATKIELRH